MNEKPVSGDADQRRFQTAVARFQSGLPPEPDADAATDPATATDPGPDEGSEAQGA